MGVKRMSITRIFRVRIENDFRQEFEDKFSSEALYKIHQATGLVSASIYKPSKWSPNEYAAISQWENEDSLKAFFGEQWGQAAIPTGAEKYVVACWLDHFESWDYKAI